VTVAICGRISSGERLLYLYSSVLGMVLGRGLCVVAFFVSEGSISLRCLLRCLPYATAARPRAFSFVQVISASVTRRRLALST